MKGYKTVGLDKIKIRMKVEKIVESSEDIKSMKELAEILDVDHQTVLLWNKGKSMPSMQMIYFLSDLFGIEVTDLVERL